MFSSSAAVVRRRVLAIATLIAFAACGGSDSGGTPTDPQGNFSFAIAPTTLSLQQGQSGTVTASLTRTGGFTGAVTGSVQGLPNGVILTPLNIASGSNSADITVNVGATVAPGSYPIAVSGQASGIAPKTVTLTLTVTAAPQADYTAALNPAALTVTPGAQGNSAIAITRSGGFAGGLSFALQGNPPTGMIVTLPATPVAGNEATVTVAVGAQVAAGSYPLTINVTGTGVPARTLTLTVTVPSLGSFTVASSPASVAITQGQTTQTTITISRTAPHVAPVQLAVNGLPNGVTAVVNPNPVTNNSATITFTATAGANVGTVDANITGTGGGVTSAPLTVPITVNASGGGGAGNVTYNFCADTGIPVFVAYRDGDGAWQRATVGTNNSYTFSLASGRGGVAYVTTQSGASALEVVYGTVVELNAYGSDECDGTADTGRNFTGTVTGVDATHAVTVVAGGATTFVIPGFSTAFSLQNVSSGPFDLLAARFSIDSGPAKFLMRRDLNPPNNSALAPIDFAGPEAFDPVQRTLTINNALGQDLSLLGLYVLRGGSGGAPYFADLEPSTATQRSWFGVPNDKRAAGDFHVLFVGAATGEAQTNQRNVSAVFREATNKTLTLPAVLNAPTVTTLAPSAGNGRIRVVYGLQADYSSVWSAFYLQGSRSVNITAATGQASNGSVTLDVPDLSTVTGWNTAWGLAPGAQTEWTFTASGWTVGALGLPVLQDGAIQRSAEANGVITP